MNKKIKYFLYVRKASEDEGEELGNLKRPQHDLNALAEREGAFSQEMINQMMTPEKSNRFGLSPMLARLKAAQFLTSKRRCKTKK